MSITLKSQNQGKRRFDLDITDIGCIVSAATVSHRVGDQTTVTFNDKLYLNCFLIGGVREFLKSSSSWGGLVTPDTRINLSFKNQGENANQDNLLNLIAVQSLLNDSNNGFADEKNLQEAKNMVSKKIETYSPQDYNQALEAFNTAIEKVRTDYINGGNEVKFSSLTPK
ncbi:MAG: hypothetical protein WC756_21550 [Taibaiella sp.]|jgi:hypothetical protein